MPRYNKLVRDRIPDLIAASGRTCETETLGDNAFDSALRAKLLEESREVAAATTPEALLLECADLLEVLDALIALNHLDPDAVRQVRQQRRDERGAFERRIRLIRTD